MRRPLALLLSGALLLAQAASSVPAFAQTYGATTTGAPVSPVVPIGGLQLAPVTPGADLRGGPTLGLTSILATAPIVFRAPPSARPAARTQPLASSDLALAGAKRTAPAGGPMLAGASLARSRDGLSPRADNAPFLNSFWTGSNRATPTAGDAVEAPEGSAAPQPLERPHTLRKPARSRATADGTVALYGSALAPALAASYGFKDAAHSIMQTLTHTLAIPAVHHAIPYAIAVAVLLLGKPIARLARRIVDKLADKANLPAGTKLVLRHAAGWATWIATGIVASQFAGIDPGTVAKSFGISSLAMSLALKGFLGNLIQGAALLLSHPFDIGDKIRVGKTEYTVVRMSLREVILHQEGASRNLHIAYSELAEGPITIFKAYQTGRSFTNLRPHDLAPPSIPKGRAWLKYAGYGALGLSLAVPGATVVHPWLLKTIPWLYAIGVAVATFFATRWAPKLAQRFAKAKGLGANETMLLSMAAPAATFLAGLATALRILGVSWEALAASAGVTGVIVTIAATEIIQSGIAALTLLVAQPFTLGDRIKVGDDHEGVVVDITLRHVVVKLDGPGEAFTLLPVGMFKKYEAPVEPDAQARK